VPRFTPPTTTYGNVEPKSRVEMWFCNNIERGLTILKKDGVYTAVDFPYQGDCDDADVCYLGGHIYEVTAAEGAALQDAGYDDCVSNWTWDEENSLSRSWDSLNTWVHP